jgi:hypothetical protein
MKSSTVINSDKTEKLEQLKEENWGYFRPGFYPIQKDNIAPAMICLGEKAYDTEHNIQFILVKTDCYLNDWEDALLVSEKDFDQITENMAPPTESQNSSDKLHALTEKFLNKGYLPLSVIIPEVQLNNIH